jgi:hypothetical protein
MHRKETIATPMPPEKGEARIPLIGKAEKRRIRFYKIFDQICLQKKSKWKLDLVDNTVGVALR